MIIPEGYAHKATSTGLNGVTEVSIHYSNTADRYIVMFRSTEEDADGISARITKDQLELLIQSANDTLEMDTR